MNSDLHKGIRRLILTVMVLCCWGMASAQAPTSTVVNNTNCTTANGGITFTAPTPTANFLFSIDGGNTFGATGQTVFSGLFGGTYATVSKNIATGVVSAVTSKVLTNPSTADPVSAVVNSTSCMPVNGSITFSGPAPVANYQYSIDGGVTFGTAGQTVFSGLGAGTYATVARSVVTNCVSDIVLKTITATAVTAPTSTVTAVTNCNIPNGVITFSAPTPVANYLFSIDGGATYGTPGQTAFLGLNKGTYATRAKLVSSGCESASVNKAVATAVVTAPTTAIVSPTSCTTPNGRITFSAPTPVASYMFSINGGATFGAAGQTVFNTLSGGTYQTVAKLISSGCVSAPVAKTLVAPVVTAPTSTVINSTSCNTPNGRITFSAPTPLASYQFSVDGGVTFGTAGQTVFNGLAAGTYKTVAKLISSGCISAGVNKVIANTVPVAPTSAVTPTACNGNTGIITFSAPTPTSNYQFSIDNGATFAALGTSSFFNLPAGTYQTRAKLVSTGCVSAAVAKVVTVAVTAAAVSSVAAVTNCNAPNGTINFTGPTPLANFAFSVDNGATFHPAGDPSFSVLTAGTYQTKARAIATGCVSAAVAKVITLPAVTAPTSTVVNSTNCAAPNGSITFTAPSAANYVFSIDGGLSFGAPGVTTFFNLSGDVYPTVSKLVSSGCISARVNKTVTKPINAGADLEVCKDQWATITSTAATGASWSVAAANPSVATIVSPNATSTLVKGLSVAGTYKFIWKTASCADTLSVVVNDCSSPIGCTNTAFLYQSVAPSGTDIIGLDISTGNQTTLYPNVTPDNFGINAVGYNVTDGHIWGSYIGTPGMIARIGADGVPVLFTIPGITSYNVGTVDNNGVFYLYVSNDTKIYKVDVNPSSPTYLTLLSPVLTTTGANVADWAFNPVDGFLYGVSTNTAAPLHELLKINTKTGAVTTLGTVTGTAAFNAGAFGAAYFDALGNLYVGDNTAGGVHKISTVQNVKGNTTAALRSQGQPSQGNDGALCQFACVKPDAGPDIDVICMSAAARMKATQVSGIGWLTMAGNPGTATIARADSANTVISGFSAPGKYNFIWTNGGGCNDTTSITVVDGCVVDRKTVSLTCPPSPVVICATLGAATRDSTTIYTVGALSAADSTQGSLDIDDNGCAVWIANVSQTDTIHTFISACHGSVCDTTNITIYPPAIDCALPVKLVSFDADKMDDASVLLQWVTASEENSKEFTIERSEDAKNWRAIRTVSAARSSSATLRYKSTDNDPSSGVNYYRLKMTDQDETFAYSRIRSIDLGAEPSVTVYPNPASTSLSIRATGMNQVERVEIINATGSSVYKSTGVPNAEINVKSFAPGIYLVRLIRKDGSVSVQKVTIVK